MMHIDPDFGEYKGSQYIPSCQFGDFPSLIETCLYRQEKPVIVDLYVKGNKKTKFTFVLPLPSLTLEAGHWLHGRGKSEPIALKDLAEAVLAFRAEAEINANPSTDEFKAQKQYLEALLVKI
jgi:hypothetical protein